MCYDVLLPCLFWHFLSEIHLFLYFANIKCYVLNIYTDLKLIKTYNLLTLEQIKFLNVLENILFFYFSKFCKYNERFGSRENKAG